jgi:hypothetical protein
MAMLAESVDGVIGVDTHRDTLAAAAVNRLGGVLAQITTSADAAGYRRLMDFAHTQVPCRRCWAVEGTGSFGAGLAGFLQQHGEQVVEMGRPKRPASRPGAKSDALAAVRAAREALGQDHLATPRRRRERAASAPGWQGSCSSAASGSSRSPDPSGQPVAAAPRATRWTRSGPPVRCLAKTTWQPHGVGVSGRRCACC